MNVARWLISVVVLLVFVVVLFLMSVILFTNPDQLKQPIEKLARQHGVILTIDSPIQWRWYPPLSVSIPHLTMQNIHKTLLVEVTDVRFSGKPWLFWRYRKALFTDLKAKSIKIKQLVATDIEASIRINRDEVLIKNLSADFYAGKILGNAQINMGKEPVWQWLIKANQMNLQSFLVALVGKMPVVVSGNASGVFYGQTFLKHSNNILQDIKGGGHLEVKNGQLHGLDVEYLKSKALTILTNSPTKIPSQHGTHFDTLYATFNLNDGYFSSKDLRLTTKVFNLGGDVQVNMIAKTLQMELLLSLKDISGISLPINVKGPYDRPMIEVDFESVKKEALRHQIEHLKIRLGDELDKRVSPKAKTLFNQLIGQ